MTIGKTNMWNTIVGVILGSGLEYKDKKELIDFVRQVEHDQEENRWIPVTERMPEEHESIVPNWGTVSKPLLVAFVCTTSEEPYPKNCVVCETMSHNGMFTHKSYSGDYKAIAWMLKPMPPKEEV